MVSRTNGEQTVSVDGHRIRISNLDKVMYPQTGTTKGEVIDYYARVAGHLIPWSKDRPATRKRWVNGVGTEQKPGEVFFQKNLDERSTPSWVTRRTLHHEHSDNSYPLVNDTATLVWLAQIASLEIHVPQWRFGPHGAQRNPDRFVIDLDPGPGTGLLECAEVARWARAILQDMGLDPLPVTSGSKGIHLYARLDGTQTSTQVTEVAHELARALETDHPDEVVSDMKKAKRDGKVLVDWSQNNGNKTTVVPYSLRGRSHPMVAMPRTWKELSSKSLRHLDFHEVLKRIEKGPVPELVEAPADGGDRLASYRSKRDASKTPEPVPDARPSAGSGTGGNSFVIQEHHASRLHWDFRLEHDGVLVSWALPKGVPTEVKQNHLAVQTEDHPIEYGGFAGDIPKGEYGAGRVDIWDSGTYDLEKWRDTEIIVVLHGEQRGDHRYALIKTGENWLIHLTKEQPGSGSQPSVRPTAGTAVGAGVAGKVRKDLPSKLHRAMLAILGSPDDLDLDESWAFEMKWDGIRAITSVEHGTVQALTRNGHDVTATYPELADLLRAVTVDVVLDGEIVALDAKGRPDFGRLQQRMNLSAPRDVDHARKSVGVAYFVFDILEREGTSTMKQSYDARRALLERTVRSTGAVQVPPAFDGDLESAVSTSRELGLEGVMAKRRDSIYLAGKRGRSWLKIKHNLTQEVVVAGWRPGNGARSGRVGSLLLGVPGNDGLHYVGRVGTGFSERELDDLTKRLGRMSRSTTPLVDVPGADSRDANWVTPSLVGEVEFAEWTSTGRLRQPRWRGWRTDKDAADVRLERLGS